MMARQASHTVVLVLCLSSLAEASWASPIQGLIDNCFACHRHPQQTSGLAVIEDRDPQQMSQLLMDYKYGRQAATLMPRLLKALSDSEIQAIALALSQPTQSQ